jgi:deoxyribonuclease-4
MKSCCGPHVGLEKTLYDTLTKNTSQHPSKDSSHPSGVCECIQCFFGSPTQYVIRKFSDEDIQKSGDYLRNHDKKLYVHAPYIINLARNSEEQMVEKGSECLSKILTTLSRVDNERTGTVLHIGANGTIANVVKHLNDLEIKSPLFLENCAGEGTKLGKNIEELRKLKEGIDSHRVGFCLDTCHCHASGMCDMRSSESIVKMFEDLDSKRVMVHLNDSLEDFGKKKDRHAILGLGKIWDINKIESFESLSTLRNYTREYGITMILETPSSNIKDYELKLLE